jgi:hypothetical protein
MDTSVIGKKVFSLPVVLGYWICVQFICEGEEREREDGM